MLSIIRSREGRQVKVKRVPQIQGLQQQLKGLHRDLYLPAGKTKSWINIEEKVTCPDSLILTRRGKPR